MRAVILRTFGNDGEVRDQPSTYEAADAIAGRKLDRRRNYAIIRGEVCEEGRWSRHCSGYTETPESTSPAHRGIGCGECGYTGRTRESMFLPLTRSA